MPAPVSPVFPAAAADDPRDRFHVVLVEPEKSINIGAVARAMTNLGFRHLHLVAPRHFERERAAVSARASAEPLLDAAVIHATLEEAVADAEEVVGLALRAPGKDPAHFVTLPQWAARLPAGRAASADGMLPRTALLFGTEDNGLSREDLELCRWIVRIPSEDALAEYNMAQSALLVLYEITRTLPDVWDGRASGAAGAATAAARPTGNDFAQLDRHLDAVMRETGFVRPGGPPHTAATVRNLFRRTDASAGEMATLLAFVARIHATLRALRRPGE